MAIGWVTTRSGDSPSLPSRGKVLRVSGSTSAGESCRSSDPEPGVVTHARHVEALRRSGDALGRATGALDVGLPREVVALELGEAADALAEIVGETTSEEILDRIFRYFLYRQITERRLRGEGKRKT